MDTLPQLFGILPTGLPPITTPTSSPTPTSFLFTLPARSYSHIAVFILPGITLPPDSAAAVYLQVPALNGQGEFKFLGGVGTGKESAIFKISGLAGGAGSAGIVGPAEIDMDAGDATQQELTLGISLEAASDVSSRIDALKSSSSSSSHAPSNALVPISRTPVPAKGTEQEVKAKLAQKIIKNAFNFLASYSGNLQNGVEVVPLKAFEEWWRKFEGKVRSDPSFLEREDGD